jgi:phosphoglycerate dehydrogenase-like enzyme
MKKRVAVLDDYLHLAKASADWNQLRAHCDIDFFHRPLPSLYEAAEVLAPYQVLCHLRERMPMPRELIERLPELEFMTVTGKAHRTMDLQAATDCGVLVSHVSAQQPGSRSTPELAWGLILSAARHISLEDRRTRAGDWQTTTGMLLDGKTLGLVGLGRVGQIMASIGKAFGMRVLAWSPNLTQEKAAEHGTLYVDKKTLFESSDVLSIHVVLSERSRHLVDAQALAWMQPHALLVNTARGPIVDEAALVDALISKRIGGAGLDVFETEPLPVQHSLRQLDNVVLTPHIGYATHDSFKAFYSATVNGLQAYLDGNPTHLLNTLSPQTVPTQ